MNTTTQMNMVVLDAPADRFLGLRPGGIALVLGLAIALIGSALCLVRPEQAVLWLAAMAFMPLVVAGLRLLPGLPRGDGRVGTRMMRSVLGAGLLIFVPLLLRLVEALGVLEFAAASRSIGVAVGIGVALAGGYLSRNMLSLMSARVGSADAARVLRFASFGVMAGGVCYAFMWLAAPLEVANLWAFCVLGAALLLVAARSFVTLRLGNRGTGNGR